MKIRIGLCLTIVFNIVMIPIMILFIGVLLKKGGWLDLNPGGYAVIVIFLSWNLGFLLNLNQKKEEKVNGEQRGKQKFQRNLTK